MWMDGRSPVYTTAEALRETLSQLESALGKLAYSPREEVIRIPALFDRAHDLLEQLLRAGADVEAEQVRFETASRQLRSRGPLFLRKIGGAAALRAARSTPPPDEHRWWWYLDREVSERRWQQLRRAGWMLLAAVAVFALLAALYVRLLAPDPKLVQMLEYQRQAEQLALSGDYEAALESINLALGLVPDDVESLVLKGVLEVMLGQMDEADAAFAAAEQLCGDRETFLAMRGQTYIHLSELERAMTDAQALLDLNPKSAYGYYLEGQVHQLRREFRAAQDSYELASTLAHQSGDAELEALIRVHLADLMIQNYPGASQPGE